jgi:hypothetical protein
MSDTSAIPSQRGDKYQDYYALFIMLKTLNDPDSRQKDLSIKIEGLDDIELSENGKICELIQTKHITTDKPLTNSSKEFWKTIGIWSELISENKVNPNEITFSLVVTVDASPNHAPKLLSEGKIKEALAAMQAFIALRIDEAIRKNNDPKKTTNKNEKAFLKFEKLNESQKLNLLKSTKIYLNEPNLDEIKLKIKELLEILSAIRKEHSNKFYKDMIGWWIDKIGTDYPSINISEVRHKIEDLRDKYPKDILPTYYEGKDILIPPNYNEHMFVKQLIAINRNRQIEEAKQDHRKAYLERTNWLADDYLSPEDITEYQEKLKKEGWKRVHNSICDDFEEEEEQNITDLDDEKTLQKLGRNIYKETLKKYIPIQKGFTAEYFMNGSYHELADREQIYWHPKFSEWLKKQG